MIFDKIEHIETYMGLNENLDLAIQVIKNRAFAGWEKGRHEISGSDVFCNVVHIDTKDESQWERHESYLDIHIVTEGSETIRCAETKTIDGWSTFDNAGDCALAPYSAYGMDVKLEPGCFLIVFPQDAHMPGLRNKSDYSEKAIFKVCLK